MFDFMHDIYLESGYPTLTLTQPWATLVMLGEKRIETRSMLFKHRGVLMIHASRELAEPTDRWALDAVLERHKLRRRDLPLGAVLGAVMVVNGCRFTAGPWPLCIPAAWRADIGEFEASFGDYREGRAGLLLRAPKPFAEPVKARGMNGLWRWRPPAPVATLFAAAA